MAKGTGRLKLGVGLLVATLLIPVVAFAQISLSDPPASPSSSFSADLVSLLKALLRDNVQDGVPGYAVPTSAWGSDHSPASNTTATVTKAAPGANLRLVVTQITVTARAAAATAIGCKATLSGSTPGTVWSAQVGTPATIGSTFVASAQGVWVGGVNESLTLACDAGPGTSNFETVSMSGYIVNVS